MTEQYLGPLITADEITSELRRRKSKDQHQTVSAANKKLIAEKVEIEQKDGWCVRRKKREVH